MGEYYRGYLGDTRSLDGGSYKPEETMTIRLNPKP